MGVGNVSLTMTLRASNLAVTIAETALISVIILSSSTAAIAVHFARTNLEEVREYCAATNGALLF